MYEQIGKSLFWLWNTDRTGAFLFYKLLFVFLYNKI